MDVEEFPFFHRNFFEKGNSIPRLHILTTLFKKSKKFQVCFESEEYERNNFAGHFVFMDEI
jgi:hypothetical protein